MRFENFFKFCPSCGSADFKVHNVKSKICESCGFVFYVNPSSAVACFITNELGQLLVCKRAKDPAKGTLDLPGGFVDEKESSEQALVREIKEELNCEVKSLNYLFSLPNEYLYSGLTIPTLDLIYQVELMDLQNLRAADDVESIKWVRIKDLNPDDFGLVSIRLAVDLFKQKFQNL